MAASRRKLAERSELLRQKEKQKKEQEEEEKEVLIEAGLNPYEVYRKRMYAGEVRSTASYVIRLVESHFAAASCWVLAGSAQAGTAIRLCTRSCCNNLQHFA